MPEEVTVMSVVETNERSIIEAPIVLESIADLLCRPTDGGSEDVECVVELAGIEINVRIPGPVFDQIIDGEHPLKLEVADLDRRLTESKFMTDLMINCAAQQARMRRADLA
jgi:hypothetical protein